MKIACPTSTRGLGVIVLTAMLAAFSYHTALAAENGAGASDTKTEFTEFSGLRSEVLTMIGGATKRVWIATDFLTDGEIVSSLYIAQYRKVQINVLLGRDRATNILSRLSYLKQVNIPVALRPRGFYSKSPTMLLIDDRLVSLNTNLDYMAKLPKFRVAVLSADEVGSFETAFLAASTNNSAPNARPLPQVGHAGGKQTRVRQGTGHNTPIQTNTVITDKIDNPPGARTGPRGEPDREAPPSGTVMQDGTYRYHPVKDKPTNGVATKLPKNTITQMRQRERDRTPPSNADVKSEATPPRESQ